MRTAAIIAEYNPFHTGHAYQIAELKRQMDITHVIVIMSGNFVQRGAPAIMDKYKRTRLALEGGADAVIELPVWAATASALDFAFGAVSILNGLNCVDYLCFGSEDGSLTSLTEASSLFLEEPPAFQSALKQALCAGKSFPKARKIAWEAVTGKTGDFLDAPNNILGISYLMALRQLGSRISPFTIKRKGSFHSESLDVQFASASALRKELQTGRAEGRFPDTVRQYLPQTESFSLLTQEFCHGYPLDRDDFWPVLKTQLLWQLPHLTDYADVPTELANRLEHLYFTASSYEELASNLKTASFTRSRIDRMLFHLLLQIPDELINRLKEHPDERYARILGFRKDHSDILGKMTASSRIPILTKALPPDSLSELAMAAYQLDVSASNLYETIRNIQYPKKAAVHEYRQKLITI